MKRIWKQRECDRCGVEKFTRKWCGTATLCEKCIEIAEKESGCLEDMPNAQSQAGAAASRCQASNDIPYTNGGRVDWSKEQCSKQAEGGTKYCAFHGWQHGERTTPYPTHPVVSCSHDWKEPVDTQFCNEKYTEVKCTKCGMVGEKTIATGEVFFPAT